MSAGQAANIIRILSIPRQRDIRFVESVVSKVHRGKKGERC